MRLGFSNGDLSTCCLCDGKFKSSAKEDADKKLLGHLGAVHFKFLITVDERYAKEDKLKKTVVGRTYSGVRWNNDLAR